MDAGTYFITSWALPFLSSLLTNYGFNPAIAANNTSQDALITYPALRPISSRCKNCRCFQGCDTSSASLSAKQQLIDMIASKTRDPSVKLAGTQPTQDTQIYILRPNRMEWKSDVIKESSFMKELDSICRKEFRKEFKKRVKLFWCEANGYGDVASSSQEQDDSTTTETTGDNTESLSFLIVPQMILVQQVQPDQLSTVLKSFLQGSDLSQAHPECSPRHLHGTHMFICCHETRDEECGVSGNILFDELSRQTTESQFQSQLSRLSHKHQRSIYMHKTSCLTGHKYPGNMILVRWDANNSKYYADSYGYVTVNDVPRILEKHVLGGEVVPELFKGRVSLDPKLAQKFLRLVCNE